MAREVDPSFLVDFQISFSITLSYKKDVEDLSSVVVYEFGLHFFLSAANNVYDFELVYTYLAKRRNAYPGPR